MCPWLKGKRGFLHTIFFTTLVCFVLTSCVDSNHPAPDDLINSEKISSTRNPDYAPPYLSPSWDELKQITPFSQLIPVEILEGFRLKSTYLLEESKIVSGNYAYLGLLFENEVHQVSEWQNDNYEIRISKKEEDLHVFDPNNRDSYDLSRYFKSQKENHASIPEKAHGVYGVFLAEELTEDIIKARTYCFHEDYCQIWIDVVCGDYLISYSYTGAPISAEKFYTMIKSARFFSTR